jgi:hypothetical protein
MTTSDEQIARAIEALARIAEDIKNEWRADRETQARESNRGFLDLNTMKPLKTESGRLVGYAFPNETITMRETSLSGAGIPPIEEFDLERNAGNPPYILLEGLTTGNAEPGKTKFFGQLVAPEGMTLEVHGTYQDVI